jgi:uncharacterized protein
MKYLLLFAFLATVWWIWSKRQASNRKDAATRQESPPEKMLTCAHCGVHMPASEGVAEGDRIYCSEAHRDAGRSRTH